MTLPCGRHISNNKFSFSCNYMSAIIMWGIPKKIELDSHFITSSFITWTNWNGLPWVGARSSSLGATSRASSLMSLWLPKGWIRYDIAFQRDWIGLGWCCLVGDVLGRDLSTRNVSLGSTWPGHGEFIAPTSPRAEIPSQRSSCSRGMKLYKLLNRWVLINVAWKT